MTDTKNLNALINEYLADYEFRGDDGDYRPNELEFALIEDALHGFFAGLSPTASELLAALAPPIARLRDLLTEAHVVLLQCDEALDDEGICIDIPDPVRGLITRIDAALKGTTDG